MISLAAVLFDDDVFLLARSLQDLQKLLDAFAVYCNYFHKQVAFDNTEAVLFTRERQSLGGATANSL